MSPYQDHIIDKLVKDPDAFVGEINSHIFEIGKKYSCIAHVSKKRLEECHGYWVEDINRALRESFVQEQPIEQNKSLDIFKYAGFLSFWLRRFTPVVKIRFIMTLGERDRKEFRAEHQRFAVFGNEIVALLTGIHLVVFHELNRSMSEVGVVDHPQRKQQLLSIFSDWLPMRDYVMIFKHKEISPYAIYLVYRSMFRAPL